MKVRVISATNTNTEDYKDMEPWYKNDIGEVFEVAEEKTLLNGCENYQVIQHNEPSVLCIKCCDCEKCL